MSSFPQHMFKVVLSAGADVNTKTKKVTHFVNGGGGHERPFKSGMLSHSTYSGDLFSQMKITLPQRSI